MMISKMRNPRIILSQAYYNAKNAGRRRQWHSQEIVIGVDSWVSQTCHLERRTGGVLRTGKNCWLQFGVSLIALEGGKVCLGDHVDLRPHSYIIATGTIDIGNNSFFNVGCYIGAGEQVSIGSNVLFGPYVVIVDGDHIAASRDIPIRDQGLLCEPVIIGDDVWLGTHVTVTKGVTIGKGAIVGANAVVTKDVPEYAIAIGAPAKVVRFRDTGEVRPVSILEQSPHLRSLISE